MSRPILILREALLASPLVILAVSLPAALRLTGGPFGFFQVWIAIACLVSVPLALLLAAARMARRSLREIVPSSRRALFVGVAVWALLSFPVDAALGLVLKTTTHHRGLGGATLGALALGANLTAALLAWRFSKLASPRGGLVAGLLNGALATALVVMTVIAARASSMAPGLLDGLVAVVATVLAARWDAPEGRSSLGILVSLLSLVAVLATGVTSLARSPGLAQAVTEQVPLARVVGQTVGLGS